MSSDVALVTGSFDPITRGHLDVIRRAAPLFRELHVAVISNPSKAPCFPAEQRVALIEAEVEDLGGVSVRSFSGLTVRLAAELGAGWIVRGLRSASDANSELPMAHSNLRCGEVPIETIFLPTSPSLSFISSGLVRQIAAEGGVLEPFVTPGVEAALRERFIG
ncbi:MAG: pantetheine-phosphate adenylyltransferase [Planctomycetota bacterium]